MQTDSTRDSAASYATPGHTRSVELALLLLIVLLHTGCFKRAAILTDDLLVPIAPPVPWLPADSDLAAARLARAALAADPVDDRPAGEKPVAVPSVRRALERLEACTDDACATTLIPLAQDVRNATLDDPIAYRAGAKEIRKQRGLDARLKNRLDRIVADDPLRLARRRIRDDWEALWARTFNAVSEPLGSSLITGFVVAPFTLANSIVHYFADFSNTEPLSARGRQALAHRKDFLARHPHTELTATLEKKIERKSVLLEKTLALRRVRLAERLLDNSQPRLSLYHANAAIDELDLHPFVNKSVRKRALAVQRKADLEVIEIDRRRALSLEAKMATPAVLDAELDFASAILARPIHLDSVETLIDRYLESGGTKDRAGYIRAIALHENGFEVATAAQLAKLTSLRYDASTMARHGRALADDDWQNPYRAFVRLRAKGARDELAWRLAGEWVRRPRYPNLPTPIAYLIDAPTIAITIVLAPLRAILSPFSGGPDFDRGAALAGYRYLIRFPAGVEQDEVVKWLFKYESRHDRHGRALRLADLMPKFDAEERLALVEKTAESRRERVEMLDRRDSRASILKGVAREFPDSSHGKVAGLQARQEAEDASAQHIRITRSFLLENPDVAGREGVGINPRLLNEDPADGELHPEGVVLRGGRMLEIRLLADGGKDKDPPESRYRKIGKARLVQIAASLDHAVHRNSLADLEARQTPDANRDAFLERASLELTDEIDSRPTAESSFVYQSLRERYGLVRGRESILPFDLVFRGSLGDFSLGAFPRWRAPKETPDSFLYR
jgi:hypothetical protein